MGEPRIVAPLFTRAVVKWESETLNVAGCRVGLERGTTAVRGRVVAAWTPPTCKSERCRGLSTTHTAHRQSVPPTKPSPLYHYTRGFCHREHFTMSLVGGYPSQSFHPAAMPHEFYPYPGHHPQQTTAHRSYPEHHPAFVNGDEAYFQSWMMAANSQHPMTSNHPVDSYGIMSSEYGPMLTMNGAVPGRMKVRVVKRRVTANKKERRRTHSINSAFSGLRDCIPNVPSDTKLSKIKTLRLATSYIAYLMHVLDLDDGNVVDPTGFKAELNKKVESREDKRKREAEVSTIDDVWYREWIDNAESFAIAVQCMRACMPYYDGVCLYTPVHGIDIYIYIIYSQDTVIDNIIAIIYVSAKCVQCNQIKIYSWAYTIYALMGYYSWMQWVFYTDPPIVCYNHCPLL